MSHELVTEGVFLKSSPPLSALNGRPNTLETDMNRRQSCLTKILVGCVALAHFACLAVPADEPGPRIRFENSCAAEAQDDLLRGITLLHSFEYPETKRIFGELIERHPDCALAYWGAAMSLWHPLWAPPSEQDLARGAALLARAEGLEATPREAAYLDALEAFFSSTDTTTHRQRAKAFELRMAEVYSDHLEDPEATLFYALALIATADPHDKSYAHQFKAAGLLNWVRSSHPDHPGVLHYLIHSYDYPELAHLGLDAAMIYAEAAPDSAHAQHMPSHIFTRLGLWEQSLSSNRDSTHSAAEYTQRGHLPGHYDEGLHSMDYLMYAMLQTARDDEAKALLDELARIETTDTENFKVAYTYAASPARYTLERREWEEASELELIREGDFDWDSFGWARSIHHFARGIGAARAGHLEKARQELDVIEKIQGGLPSTTLPYWREEVQVHADAVRAWILLDEGGESEALELAAKAADREDAVDKHPVTPGEVLPARELYADMLLETGRFAEALEQYQIVLRGAPNRLNALIGAARAAGGVGQTALQTEYRDAVRTQTRPGNPRRAGVAQIP